VNNLYKSILGATKVYENFPRKDDDDHYKALLSLKPAFFKEEPLFSWIDDKARDVDPIIASARAGSSSEHDNDTASHATTGEPGPATQRRGRGGSRGKGEGKGRGWKGKEKE
jgi:hypothetical protein